MKTPLQNNKFLGLIKSQVQNMLLASSMLLPIYTHAAPLSLATVPLATATTTNVLPNLMFTLDDSGSMASNYLPDWAADSLCKSTSGSYDANCNNQPPYRSSDFNAIYYNPAIRYKPAVSDSGAKVNTSGDAKGSQTTWTSVKNDAYNIQSTSSTNLVTSYPDEEWCTDSAYTDCLRNDNYILPGTVNGKVYKTSRPSVKSTGSGLAATGSPLPPTGSPPEPTTVARSWGPHYYTIIPGEYCDTIKLTNCQTTQTATFKYPAKVRWCNSSANSTAATPAAGSCQAIHKSGFTNARYPTKFYSPAVAGSPAVPAVPATPAVAPANGSFKVTDVGKNKSISATQCGATKVTSSGNFNSANSNTLATRLDSLIPGLNGSANGYTITCSKTGSPTTSLSCVVTAPAGASACSGGFTVDGDITKTNNTGPAGGADANPGSPFIPAVPATNASYYGSFKRTDIVPSITSYPKATTRTDCLGASCTYAEEMTNFANWWTYYQTRMQAMKTGASLAFFPIDSKYRVGFNSISYTGATDGTKFLHIDTFDAAHRALWYTKLLASNPTSTTPLRAALSKTGQIFAHKLSGAADPVQYSCQQNFTILSTDGYWNTNLESGSYGPFSVTGANVGNRDSGSTPLPMREGVATTNSLADVAKYYYDTDLRDASLSNCTGSKGLDVCENNVFVSGTDNNIKQHMTTFTLGLGVNGTLLYSRDYKTATSGDFYDLKNGFGTPTVAWSDSISKTEEERVDDLWHAAVNGQGTYFSAQDPSQLTQGLTDALSQINAKIGAGAAAATSTLNPVAGNNFAYVASYTTVKWAGNLESRTINLTTGEVSEAATWCVEDVIAAPCSPPSSIVAEGATHYCVTPSSTSCSGGTLVGTDCKVEVPVACTGTLQAQANSGTRKIYMNKGNALVDFTYGNLTATQKLNFESTALSANLSQWSSLDPATQQVNAKQANLVNYLRGDNDYEDSASNATEKRVFRYREDVMGDALESAPVYIGTPSNNYLEPSYAGFKEINRASTVYLGTNDGMLHAFNASDGTERWAYVPSMVIPNMWKLADANYATMHTNYVNGTTTVSDICTSTCAAASNWKTILVGGLNGGGKGYYALDVTSDTPALLWEFDTSIDSDLGYSFGNPIVTKLKPDASYPFGRWVVILTSGYNNTGQGYLYVRDAYTGSPIRKISTNVGDATTPSGLAKISAYIENANNNNEASYIYGGDLLGNLWRFDINADGAAGSNPFLLATLKSGVAQPITTAPELAKIGGKRIVFVGTGKYLETTDLTDTSLQSVYAIKDTDTALGDVHNNSTLIKTNIALGGATRTGTETTTNVFTSGNGWFADLPDTGERQNVAAKLVAGTLVVPTTVPSNTVCSPGGYGWVTYFNYKTGGAVPGSDIISSKTNAPPVGINVVYINEKPVVTVTTSSMPTPQLDTGARFPDGTGEFSGTRAIWRELIVDE